RMARARRVDPRDRRRDRERRDGPEGRGRDDRAGAALGHGHHAVAGRTKGIERGARMRAPLFRHPPLNQSAASLAWYVRIWSAPARRIAVSTSRVVRRSSSQPLAAAAFTIEYSPLTLYAAIGNPVASFAARITSRYGSAGFTITISAPSSMSVTISRTASSTL